MSEEDLERLRFSDSPVITMPAADADHAGVLVLSHQSPNGPMDFRYGANFPATDISALRVLLLRNCGLTDLAALHLDALPSLVDLDVGFNAFHGVIPKNAFPKGLERLDVSGNALERLDHLSEYQALSKVREHA